MVVQKRTSRFRFMAILLVMLFVATLIPVAVFAKPSLTNGKYLVSTKNGKDIFYVDLARDGRKAIPYGAGPAITGSASKYSTDPNTWGDYRLWYSNNGQNFSVITSTQPHTMNETSVAGTTTFFNDAEFDFDAPNPYTGDRAHYAAESNATSTTFDYYSDYSIVAGPSGDKNVLRVEYTVTNKTDQAQYVGGKMNVDTQIGSNSGGPITDKALTMVDNTAPFEYDATSNPLGFLEPGGAMQYTARFVDRRDPALNDPNKQYVSGIPTTWQNVMVFREDNPVAAYYSVQPDKANTDDHSYPLPNVVDFTRYNGTIHGGASVTPTWMPMSKQVAGLTNAMFGADYVAGTYQYGQTGPARVDGNDSALSVQWNKQKVESGDSISFVYFVGVGKVDIASAGKLTYSLNAAKNIFDIATVGVDEKITPMDVNLSLKNTDTIYPIKDIVGKIAYDDTRLIMLDENDEPMVPAGMVSTTLNGVTKEYPYIIVTKASIEKNSFAAIKLRVTGITDPLQDTTGSLRAILDFTDATANGTPFTNVVTNELNLTVPGKLKVDFSPGYIHVVHKDEASGDILLEYDIAGIVGESADSYRMYFPNFALKTGQPETQQGTLLRGNIAGAVIQEHVYLYEAVENPYNLGTISVVHLGKNEKYGANEKYDILLAVEQLHGVQKTYETVKSKEWLGYLPAEASQTRSIKYGEEPQVVTFVYPYDDSNPQGYQDVYKNSGRIIVNHVDESTGQTITKDTLYINMDLPTTHTEVTVKALDIATYALADELSKKVIVNSGQTASVDIRYRKTGYIHVEHRDSVSNALLYEEYAIGPVNTPATVYSSNFATYKLAASQGLVNATKQYSPLEDAVSVVFYYDKVTKPLAGDIVIIHRDVDDAENVLAVEQVHGKVGEVYHAVPKSIAGYQTSSAPAQDVAFEAGVKEIVFEYTYNEQNQINVSNVGSYSAWVDVEYRDKNTNLLIAKDKMLVDIPYGDVITGTEKTIEVQAKSFDNYSTADQVTKQVSAKPGATRTVLFYYEEVSSDTVVESDYKAQFLDNGNFRNLVGSQFTIKGKPGQMVDLSTLVLPEGYLLDSANQNEIHFPQSSADGIDILLREIASNDPNYPIEQYDVLVEYNDVRGVAVSGVITEIIRQEPDKQEAETVVPETTAEAFAAPATTEEIPKQQESAITEETIEESATPGTTIEAEQKVDSLVAVTVSTEEEIETESLPAEEPSQESVSQPNMDVSPSLVAPAPFASGDTISELLYNKLLAARLPGATISLVTEGLVPAGYGIVTPASKNYVFYDQGLVVNGKKYARMPVTLHPLEVTVQFNLQDESGTKLGDITQTYAWHTAVNSGTMNQLPGEFSNYSVTALFNTSQNESVFIDTRADYDSVSNRYPVTVILKESTLDLDNNIPGPPTPPVPPIPPKKDDEKTPDIIVPDNNINTPNNGEGNQQVVDNKTKGVNNQQNKGGGQTGDGISKIAPQVNNKVTSQSTTFSQAKSGSTSTVNSKATESGTNKDKNSSASQANSKNVLDPAVGAANANSVVISGETEDQTSGFTAIMKTVIPMANLFPTVQHAIVFYLGIIALLAFLLVLVLASMIKVEYHWVENEEEKTATAKFIGKKICRKESLYLDITKAEVVPHLTSANIEVQFGSLYTKALQNTSLKLVMGQNKATLALQEVPEKRIVHCQGDEFSGVGVAH